ncbi:MAG: hypothetical protein ACI8X3_002043, partial [Saprospiraceae bacterium]
MNFKSHIIKPLAKKIARDIDRWSSNAVAAQDKVFKKLMKGAANTAFAKDHGFENISGHEAFAEQVPIRDYEGLKPYIERIKNG